MSTGRHAASPAIAGPGLRPVGAATSVAAMAGSQLRSWARDPVMLVQALVFPGFLLLVFDAVLASAVTRMGGVDSIGGTTALLSLVSAMQGTLVASIRLIRARDGGLLDRWWTLPMPRLTVPLSRVLAELIRAMVTTVVLVIVGVLLGLRVGGGVPTAIPCVLAAVLLSGLFGTACSALVLALTVRGTEKSALSSFSGLFMLLMFFNTGFAPADAYPGWIRWFIRWQPMSPAIDAMRAFFAGDPDWGATAVSLAWSAVILGVFGTLAGRALRSVIGAR